MRAISLAVMGLSLLGIFTVHSAPVNVTVNKTGFMEVMYSNLAKRNLSTWIFPPKEDSINASAIFKQVDTSCQTHSTDHNLIKDSEMPSIYYACASMLETIDNIWAEPRIEKLIEDNKDKIKLPSKLDDLYKEEDLRNTSEFCLNFSKLLNKKDFSTNLSKFLDNFTLQHIKSNSSCKTVCQNAQNKSVIYLGEVNPVCAIWRKGYYIFKVVTGKKNEEQATNLYNKPIDKQDDKEDKPDGGEEEDHDTNDNVPEGDTETKKRMQLVADTEDPVLAGAGTSKGKQLSLKTPLLLEKTKTVHKTTKKDEQLQTNDEKSPKSVNEKTDETTVSESGDKDPSEKIKDEDLRPVKENSISKVISSSTQSSDVAPDNPPMPPISKDQLSSPKPISSIKESKSSSASNVNQQPPSKSPSGVGASSKLDQQQNQNEAPPEADYDGGDMPPPSLSEKGRMYDETDDETDLETDQNPRKPKLQSSVSVSKEKHAGAEIDKVSIEGDSATVNVEFNEQSDPGVINYFVCFLGLLAILYLLFHNKKRLIAYVVEGRKPQGGRRRSSSTQYRKLENNYD